MYTIKLSGYVRKCFTSNSKLQSLLSKMFLGMMKRCEMKGKNIYFTPFGNKIIRVLNTIPTRVP